MSCSLRSKPLAISALRGEKLMIISNGAAPAALALDELWLRNGNSPRSAKRPAALRQALPETIDITNPLDLRDDASSEHYLKALNVLLDSHDYDALLVIHSPALLRRGQKARWR